MTEHSLHQEADGAGTEEESVGSAGPDAERLREALEALYERAQALEVDGSAPAAEVVESLEGLERELQEAIAGQSEVDPESERGELAALLSDLRHWRGYCRQLGLGEAADTAQAQVERLLAGAADTWQETHRPLLSEPEAEACFDALLHTTILQLETHSHFHDPSTETDRFVGIRRSLREALRRALEAQPPDEQQLGRWTTALTDNAAMVLTAVDELQPGAAAVQLETVADDLQWHLDHVETERGSRRRRLRRKLARILAEREERQLQGRLEGRFGQRFVAFSERTILVLICLVVGLMSVEWIYNLSPRTLFWFRVIDTAACACFLAEFGVKWALTAGSWRWFRRHLLIDLIPSIPVGLLLMGVDGSRAADAVRSGRLARFLRLPRLLRYLRLLRPIIRIGRAFGLLARAMDRLVRRYGQVLNRNVILCPTREEMERSSGDRAGFHAMVRRVRVELRERWEQLLLHAEEDEQHSVARRRLDVLHVASGRASTPLAQRPTLEPAQSRELPASVLLDQLCTATAREVEAELGEEAVSQLARMVRIFARPPVRWLPIISSFAPRLSEEMSDAEAVAAASRKFGGTLRRVHDAWFWCADLYGTVTPSQFVDRVGTMLVNSSFRPAYRLALFGGGFLLVEGLLAVVTLPALEPVENLLQRFVGPALLVLGSVCLIVLGVGWWMKRLAQEATEFYERAAQARFLPLMELIRTRQLHRDAAILHDRVVGPEWPEDPEGPLGRTTRIDHLAERLRGSMVGDAGADDAAAFEAMDRVVMLFRDRMDGAPLAGNDTRTTTQLLGDPAIGQFLEWSHRIDRRHRKELDRIDLKRQKSLFGGPYLWFNFISQAVVHAVATALVDYNRHAIPRDQLSYATTEQRQRYQRWLDAERTDPERVEGAEKGGATEYMTTEFTALHFLDDDAHRDREIERRFGPELLQRLRADRRRLIRRIFGTYPLHRKPKDQRVVNLYLIYESWLSGGRALFLPWFLFVLGLRGVGRGIGWVARSVKEIRRPERRAGRDDAGQADFLTAVRKIGRIRRPAVLASLRLRMRMDPEYLGVPLPGERRAELRGADVEPDRRFLRMKLSIEEEIHRQRRRARADMHRLGALIEGGLFRRAAERVGLPADAFELRRHRRAAAVAYLADMRGVRSYLSAEAILRETFRSAAVEPMRPRDRRPHPKLRKEFKQYWRAHGFGGSRHRRAAWRAVAHNINGAAEALSAWAEYGKDVKEEGERRMGELLRRADQIEEQLISLRTVQSLAALDVLNYREHIHRLGGYAESEDEVEHLLRWGTTAESGASQPAPAAAGV